MVLCKRNGAHNKILLTINCILCQCVLLCVGSMTAFGTTIYVSTSGGNIPPFASWAEASTTIQDAIDLAADGDTVLLASGTFTGNGNRDLRFGGKVLLVRSVQGPDFTIIDCEGTKSDPHRGFVFKDNEDSSSFLSGITIRSGYAPFDAPSGTSVGGAILCDSSSPTIENCVLKSNTAHDQGGGLACINGAEPIIRECRFEGNLAINRRLTPIGGLGGGMRCENARPTIIGCTFSFNTANLGGGLSCNNSPVTVDSCTFHGNRARYLMAFEPQDPGLGGGLHFFKSHGTISNTIFLANHAEALSDLFPDAGRGGGAALILSDATVVNCTFYANTAESLPSVDGHGSGIFCSVASPTVSQCIISHSPDGNAVYCADTLSFPVIECSDIFGNARGDWVGCIAGQAGLSHNFSLDPQYCDPPSGELTLRSESPCLPSTSGCGLLVGAKSVGCDSTNVVGGMTIPMTFHLYQNRPNPLNSSTWLSFVTAYPSEVSLTIFNPLGQRVVTLLNGHLNSGRHDVMWKATNHNGEPLASGVYIYALSVNGMTATKKLTIIR